MGYLTSKDKLNVKISDSRDEMGMTAAKDIAKTIRELQKSKKEINIIFAAAPSQNETLKHLINEPEILKRFPYSSPCELFS